MKLNLDITPIGRSEVSVAEVFRFFPDDPNSEHRKVTGILTVDNTGSRVFVQGLMAVTAPASCARCLKDFELGYESAVEILIIRDGAKSPEDSAPDTWIIHCLRGMVDLDDALRESAILNMPLKAVCRYECLGFCPTCGVNRNESPCECTTTTSDLRWDNLPS